MIINEVKRTIYKLLKLNGWVLFQKLLFELLINYLTIKFCYRCYFFFSIKSTDKKIILKVTLLELKIGIKLIDYNNKKNQYKSNITAIIQIVQS